MRKTQGTKVSFMTLFLALTFSAEFTAYASDYYVDAASGNDTYSGTQGNAFKTLDKGLLTAYNVNIAAGTNALGRCLESGTVRLASGVGDYTLSGTRYVEGNLNQIDINL